MQHPIEICLTAGEWVEDKRGRTAARWARKEPETKTIATFLSQGAVGGAVGYFLLVAFAAIIYPAGWNLSYCFGLPLILALGAIFGSIIAILIWLPGVLLKRRLNFFARAVVVTGVTAVLSLAFSHLGDGSETERWPMSWTVSFACMFYLPIVLVTGSRVRPCHLLLLGAGPRNPRYNLGSWLSIPAGFLLRTASIFGLLEALLLLALWISSGRTDWQWFPERAHLPAIILAVLYFAASSYFSIKTPRKFFLPPTIILLNLPLASLIVHLEHLATSESAILSHILLAIICLWVVYTLGRLIAPESARGVVGSWSEAAPAPKFSPSSPTQVQA